jgi:hypothetical protein
MDPKSSGLQDGRRDEGEALVVGIEAPGHGQPFGSEPGSSAKSRVAPYVEQQPPAPDRKLEQHCDWCNKPFRRRHGSGGSQQRFCSSECRMSFHKERQRTQRRASHAGPTTLPASGRSTQNETLTGKVVLAELHPDQHVMSDTPIVIIEHSDALGIRLGRQSREFQIRLSEVPALFEEIIKVMGRQAHGAALIDRIIAAARARRPRDRTNAERQRRFRQRRGVQHLITDGIGKENTPA